MRIRLKTTLLLTGSFLAFVAFLYFSLSFFISGQFAKIENAETVQDVERGLRAVQADVESLGRTVGDYAGWDDSYAYIDDHNQAYIDSNFQDDGLVNLKVNFVVYIDQQRNVVFQKGYDLRTSRQIPTPPEAVEQFTHPGTIFHFEDIKGHIAGIMMTGGKAYIIDARPILTSSRQGPVRGTIVMGRLLDTNYIEDMGARTRLPLAIEPSLDGPLGTIVRVIAPDSITGSAPIMDIYGKPALRLHVTLPRPVYGQGVAALQYVLLALLGLGLFFVVLVILLLDGFVLYRISYLAESVGRIKNAKKPEKLIPVKGNDEIAEFSRALRDAFHALDQSQLTIRAQRERLEAILKSIGDAVLVIDTKRNIVLVNHITERLSKFSAKELFGKSYRERLRFETERDGTELTEFIDRVFRGEKRASMTEYAVLVHPDGTRLPIALTSAPLLDAGKLVGCVVVFRDVAREREIDRMKSEFISVASHQLRTPLSGIKWVVELMLGGGKLTAEQKAFLGQIMESTDRMIYLVEDLLNVSHIETGRKFLIVQKPDDIIRVLREILTENLPTAQKKKIVLSISADAPPACMVSIDTEKIRQAVENLVNNALKYTPEGGSVTMSAECPAGGPFVFNVKDTGMGIPKDEQKRVFERFFRAENAVASEIGGTGLGLYIVKSIIEGHGGKIWFESVQGKGSTFSFSLPTIKPAIKTKKA